MNAQVGNLVRSSSNYFQEHAEFLATLFEKTVGYGIFAADFDGRIVACNAGARHLFQYADHELVGLAGIDILFPAEYLATGYFQRMAEVLFETGRFVHQGEMVRKDGERFFADIRFSQAMDSNDRVIGYVLIVQDITERLRAQERIANLNAELEQRVRDRTAQMEAANQEMEAFAYSVSHDLRAPLRAIDGFSQILMRECLADLAEKPRHYLQMVSDNARQMGLLIDDILRLSRLGRQSLLIHSVTPGPLVNQCLEELQAEREGRNVRIQVGALPECRADGNLLKQAWFNLLSNALKYTRKRDPARIEIGSFTSPEGETVYFVKDNGVGFDMQYAPKLFGVFQRLHSAGEYEGTGVGLALTKRIVQRHGGRIWAEARPDQGASFYFTIGGSMPEGKKAEVHSLEKSSV